MSSPKFHFSLPKLQKCINEKVLTEVWKQKIGAQLRKQIFLDLIEYRDYTSRIDILSHEICREIAEGRYRPAPVKTYLVEKSRGLCRQMTSIQPRDLLVMQALSGFLYADLKKHQPTKFAFFEPGDHKFSKGQLLYKGNEYGSVASWRKFQQTIFAFAKDRKWLVVTDIANFYDFINFRHLRNIVASYCNASESILDLLIFILNEISWTPDYMPRTEIGLPQIEIEAPRVLANAMLYELDEVAAHHSGGDYARFMDDIDVGVNTLQQAKKVIRDIDLTLQTRQLRLNSSKTRILNFESGEIERHFCIRENRFLDFAATVLESKTGSVAHVRKALQRAYVIWRGAPITSVLNKEESRFFSGNGSKIFKRLVILAAHVQLNLLENDLLDIIWLDPGLRQYSFNALTRLNKPNSAFYKLKELFERVDFVDDQAIVHMALFLVHSNFRRDVKFEKLIRQFTKWCMSHDKLMYSYSGFLIASKFLSPQEIYFYVDQKYDTWKRDFWLGRCVAGLYPRMCSEKLVLVEFVALIQKSDNAEATAVLGYHLEIEADAVALKKVYGYARSPNPSFAHKLIHSKALIILSIKQNPKAAAQMKQLLKDHPILLVDPFYRKWFT